MKRGEEEDVEDQIKEKEEHETKEVNCYKISIFFYDSEY